MGLVAFPGLRIEIWGTQGLGSVRVAAIAGFAVVAFGHPDSLNRYGRGQVLALDQISFRAIGGLKDLCDLRAADLPTFSGEPLAE